jgi:hypothetical protein
MVAKTFAIFACAAVAAAQQPAIVPNSPNDSSGPTDGAGLAASARLDSTVGYSSSYNGISSRREVGSAHVVTLVDLMKEHGENCHLRTASRNSVIFQPRIGSWVRAVPGHHGALMAMFWLVRHMFAYPYGALYPECLA